MSALRQPMFAEARAAQPFMDTGTRSEVCRDAPWWVAPVIVGGSGGSGTRGSVLALARLGVGMACSGTLFDVRAFNETEYCNRASDFSWLGGRLWRHSWLVQTEPIQEWKQGALEPNLTNCSAPDNVALEVDQERGTDLLGMRRAVMPPFRERWRWGMKNPHATYELNVLLRFFPCMVYVNTMRDISEMARKLDHFSHRTNEAHSLGWPIAPPPGSSVASVQQWYAEHVYHVNLAVASWASTCMPPNSVVYLPAMNAARCSSAACNDHLAASLSSALMIEEGHVREQLGAYAQSSQPICKLAHDEAMQVVLEMDMRRLPRWPSEMFAPECECM
jgi:hypothetical protein